jgi:hypothetical protein
MMDVSRSAEYMFGIASELNRDLHCDLHVLSTPAVALGNQGLKQSNKSRVGDFRNLAGT